MNSLAAATLIMLGLLAVLVPAQAQQKPADKVFLNGNIYAGVTADFPKQVSRGEEVRGLPRVQALAVQDGRIVAAGSDAEIRKLAGEKTEVVDLGGHFVMPGFNDAHLHLGSGGRAKLNVDLVGITSLEEMKRSIARHAQQAAPGEWLVGRGWDHTKWAEKKLPSRYDLDEVTGGHPAMFHRVDGHIAVVNSKALELAGVGRETPDPEGGSIDRDAQGRPTGILRETAMDLVARKRPAPSPSQRRRGMELALREAAQWGLTSAQDNSDWEDFLVLEDLEREGKLTLRISEWLPFGEDLEVLRSHSAHHPQNDPWLHTGMLKGFMDGSLGSRTAALLQAYADDPGNSGLPRYQQDELDQLAIERVQAGFQLGFHAIGDGAVAMALVAFEAATRAMREKQGGQSDLRLRIEHAQVVTSGQFARFRDDSVIASMQPNHLLTDMNWALQRLGDERAETSYAWARFLQQGVMLAFGTDYPVEPLTPFRGIYAALTRKSEDGSKTYPGRPLTIHQAIAAYTSGSAYAEFAEEEKGTLQPGMLADFVVLDRDLTTATPEQVLHTKVLRTAVGGRTVYEAQ